MSITLKELAPLIGATLQGDGDAVVDACAPLESAKANHVTFLANPKYTQHLADTSAGAVLLSPDITCPAGINALFADDPYFAFRNAMVHLHGYRRHPEPMAGHQPAIHEDATVDPTAEIHPFAVVEAGASIGARTVLYPGVYVGANAQVGCDTICYPNVVIYNDCIVGDRVILHSATVIGQDGFGFATHPDEKGEVRHHKIPQTGITVIEDDVELGAGCMIERAALGETRIGAGTKMADLISIGHGTTTGKHNLYVSLVGISGSVNVGNYVVLGGQVGVTGHLNIGDGVQAMARSAIAKDIPAGEKIGGVPAIPYQQAKKNAMAGINLYDLFKRVRALERRIAEGEQERSS